MKFNKQLAIILVLVSLLLSALGGAFYYYKLNEKSVLLNNQLRVIYVASQNIDKNSKIEKKHLKRVTVAKKYVLTTPLLKKEIIGKYARENIYKNDLFRKEKIMNKLGDDLNSSVIDSFKHNSYNIAFSMFKNPNYSLRKGDIIDIVSVYPAKQTKFSTSPNAVQFVASQIHVLGFLSEGKECAKTINKKTITKTVKKKKIKQVVYKKANELLIDIDSKVLLSLIDDYNRGNQLWMVKTHLKKPLVKEIKKKSIVKKEKCKATTKKSKKETKVKRVYKVQMYKMQPHYKTINASIYYGADKQASIVKNRKIKVDKVCKKGEYLLGLSREVHLRSGASKQYKIKKVIYRNYIIPFSKVVNNEWYMTCDGYYVHTKEVRVITKESAKKRLGKEL